MAWQPSKHRYEWPEIFRTLYPPYALGGNPELWNSIHSHLTKARVRRMTTKEKEKEEEEMTPSQFAPTTSLIVGVLVAVRAKESLHSHLTKARVRRMTTKEREEEMTPSQFAPTTSLIVGVLVAIDVFIIAVQLGLEDASVVAQLDTPLN